MVTDSRRPFGSGLAAAAHVRQLKGSSETEGRMILVAWRRGGRAGLSETAAPRM
jgi:hypothetical protein